eukprot:55062-Prorocentrum_minimum.AAC.1
MGPVNSAKADLEKLLSLEPITPTWEEARKLAYSIAVRQDKKHRSTEETEDEKKHRRQQDVDRNTEGSTEGSTERRLPSELPESVFPALLREGYIQVLPENTNREPSNILF